jgi:hypothetical protein
MHGHPVQGVKGGKPPRLTSKPGPQIAKLSEEYLRVCNRGQRAKAQQSEMLLARARGELIEKRLVERQAAFLLVTMRQKILNISQAYARRLTGLKDVREVKRVLEGAAISILNEIKDLPNAISDPDWLAKVEEGVGK